jgi:hypothetical protein
MQVETAGFPTTQEGLVPPCFSSWQTGLQGCRKLHPICDHRHSKGSLTSLPETACYSFGILQPALRQAASVHITSPGLKQQKIDSKLRLLTLWTLKHHLIYFTPRHSSGLNCLLPIFFASTFERGFLGRLHQTINLCAMQEGNSFVCVCVCVCVCVHTCMQACLLPLLHMMHND